MRFKSKLLSSLILCSILQANPDREENVNFLIQQRWVNQGSSLALEMAVQACLCEHAKTADSESLVAELKRMLKDGDLYEKLSTAYDSFSDQELEDLRKILEHPAYKKYVNEMCVAVFQIENGVITNQINHLIDQLGTVKEVKVETALAELTDQNFYSEIFCSRKPIIIDFYSDSCMPCKLMEPTFAEFSDKYKGSVRFGRVNCDHQRKLVEQFQIRGVPTVLFIKPGAGLSIEHRIVGYDKRSFKNEVSQVLSSEAFQHTQVD